MDLFFLHNHIFLGDTDSITSIWRWFGEYHVIFLHFPIALVVMTAISELLFRWKKEVIYDHASKFMLISAAISFIPTAISGLAYSSSFLFEGTPMEQMFWWHRFWGVFSMLLSFAAVGLRMRQDRTLYYLVLLILLIAVFITGDLGGKMAFGG